MSDNCRDFENGKCNRGVRCKFFHPKLQICKDFQNKKCDRSKCKFLHITKEEESTYESSGVLPDHIDVKDAQSKKIYNRMQYGGRGQEFGGGMYGKRPREENFNIMPDVTGMSGALLEENELLKRKITDLQRQVMELRQMNDTLYDQNTRYRNQLRSSTGVTTQAAGGLTSGGVSDLATNRNYYDFGN